MFIVIGLMLTGVFIGFALREKVSFAWVGKAISVAIFALLFLLGVGVGINEQIMNNLDTLGVDALIITMGGLIGSIALAWLIYWYLFKREE
jgi:uncharacterized membrane protein YbjE (DUF340 family)